MSEQSPDNPSPGPGAPRIIPVAGTLRVTFAGAVVAETARGLRVAEPDGATSYYVPAEDVKRVFLAPMRYTAECPWRGHTRYYALRVRGRESEAAAWEHPSPGAGYAELAGRIAFHAARVDEASEG